MTLKQMRESKSMSQNEVARELEVTVTTVSKWETGRANPQPQYVRGLAKLYGVSITEVQEAVDATQKDSPKK